MTGNEQRLRFGYGFVSAGGYPAAHRLNLVEDLFGHQVADPYRWLEDAGSPQTRQWLAAEEELWAGYRDGLPRREEFTARVRELLRVGSVGLPAWRGTHPVLHAARPGPGARGALRRDGDGTRAADGDSGGTGADGDRAGARSTRSRIDPTGRTTLDAWPPDKEGRLLAYQLSHGGDEESLLRVIDVATGELVDGPIDRCRYSGVAWLPGGKAFYYTRRLPPDAVPAGEAQYHRRVYLHVVGTSPEADTEVFGAGRDKTTYYGVSVSLDGRWLIVSASVGTAPREDIWIADLTACDPAAPVLVPLMIGLDAMASPRVGRDGRLYVLTDLDAPRGRICVADPAAPGPGGWRDLVARGPVGGAAQLRDPRRRRAGPAGAGGVPHPARGQRGQRARPGHRGAAVARSSCRASGPSAGSRSGPRAGTRRGSATRTTRRRRWCSATTPRRARSAPGRRRRARLATGRRAVTASQVTYHSADGTAVRMVIIEPARRKHDARSGEQVVHPLRLRRLRHQPDPRRTRRTSSPGSRRAACTRSPGCAAAARRARSGTAPGCSTASRTCSTTSTRRPST